jgi:hypothetical protein
VQIFTVFFCPQIGQGFKSIIFPPSDSTPPPPLLLIHGRPLLLRIRRDIPGIARGTLV